MQYQQEIGVEVAFLWKALTLTFTLGRGIIVLPIWKGRQRVMNGDVRCVQPAFFRKRQTVTRRCRGDGESVKHTASRSIRIPRGRLEVISIGPKSLTAPSPRMVTSQSPVGSDSGGDRVEILIGTSQSPVGFDSGGERVEILIGTSQSPVGPEPTVSVWKFSRGGGNLPLGLTELSGERPYDRA